MLGIRLASNELNFGGTRLSISAMRRTPGMNLLAHALDVLSDPNNPPGLREAACAALVAGLEENLAVPHGTPIAIWRWVRETTPKRWCAAQFRLGEVYDEAVFVATLEAVRDSGSGTELRQVAIDVLAGSAFAPLVTDDILQDVVDRPHVEPERLTRFVEAVHKGRGIPTDLLRAVRDRWAASTVPTTREAAIAVGALVPKPEDDFWSKMIGDPHEDVRMSAIQVVAKNARTTFASKRFQERLDHEGVADVRAELHRGMMTVLHREGRGEE
jgi:GNAT superfamily N-acetyltransferase